MEPGARRGRLTLRELCDLTYALMVERTVAQTLAAQVSASVLAAAGAKGQEWPDVGAEIRKLDEMLAAPPPEADSFANRLRRAMGMRVR